MNTYQLNNGDRKSLANRIAELTGQEKKYTGVPRCAYVIGAYAVERDGTLRVEGQDEGIGIIRALMDEGLIKGSDEQPAETTEDAEATETTETTEDAEAAETTETGEAIETTEPMETRETTDANESAQTEEESTGDNETAELEETPETWETTEIDGVSENAEQPEDSSWAEAADPYGFLPDTGDNILKPEISFPASAHTGATVRNLVNLIYSRGTLVSKSTGGSFWAAEGLVEALKYEEAVQSFDCALKAIRDYEEANGTGLRGATVTEEKITFDGFPEEGDPGKIRAFMDLAAAMNRQALTQNRIQAKAVDDENEKYIYRIWLVRIGLDKKEYKETRRYLLANLNGHTAFRTKADEDRWKAAQKAKREKLKAEKLEAENAAEEGQNAVEASDLEGTVG